MRSPRPGTGRNGKSSSTLCRWRATYRASTNPIVAEIELVDDPPPRRKRVRKDVPPIAVPYAPSPIVAARCTACQSLAGFEGGRCLCCGLSGTEESMPHVDGRAA